MEDLAYRRLLDWYYLHETPIPLDITETSRQIRMRTHCDCIATVLQEYFVRTDGGWTHGRADKEIAKTGDKSAKASESAKKRWAMDANAMRTHSEGNATHNTRHITQDTDKKPSSSGQSPDKDKKKFGTQEDHELVQWMHELIKTIVPNAKTPNWDSWANEIRLIRERDGRTPDEIKTLFVWANSDSFWRTNILSPDTLRKQWDKLTAKLIAANTAFSGSKSHCAGAI